MNGIRKIHVLVEEIVAEGGRGVDHPARIAATGATIDLAIKHKTDHSVRSHHQSFEVRIPDARVTTRSSCG